jgi:multisubunit Na+/H+ antiporter MnhC subunit
MRSFHKLSPRLRAHLWAVALTVLIAIPMVLIWYAVGLYIYLAEGGTIGGYGAAGQGGSRYVSWADPVYYGMTVLVVVVSTATYVLVLKRLSRGR